MAGTPVVRAGAPVVRAGGIVASFAPMTWCTDPGWIDRARERRVGGDGVQDRPHRSRQPEAKQPTNRSAVFL